MSRRPWKPDRFVREAGVLAGAGFLVKMIGGLLRIPLTRLMGPEGMGLYQMAYAVYGLMITLCVSGFPLAVSRLVAERLARKLSPAPALRACGLVMGLVGALAAAALYFGAGFLAGTVVGEPRAAAPIRGIAPALLLVSLMAVFRGYFQGHQRMGPTALSQVAEQVTRVAASLVLVSICLPISLDAAAQGAAMGTSLGAAAGLVLLIHMFRNRQEPAHKAPPDDRGGGMVGRMVAMAVPISLGALLLPALDALNAILIPSRLQSVGVEVAEATSLYGQLAGVALPMMGLPAVVSISLAASLVPEVTAASAARDGRRVSRDASTALGLAFLMSVPAAAGLWVLAGPIGSTLFGLPQVGPLLRIIAPGCVFLSLQHTSTGLLLGLGRPVVPLYSLAAGVIINGSLVWLLTPTLGIAGAALALPLGLLGACVVNLLSLGPARGVRVTAWIRPLVAAMCMGAAVLAIHPVLGGVLGQWGALLGAVGLGAGVYFLILVVLGVPLPV